MNAIFKILFWIFTIALGFVNPLISFGLIFLYYLPGIIQDMCRPCRDEKIPFEINSFSDDVMEEIK